MVRVMPACWVNIDVEIILHGCIATIDMMQYQTFCFKICFWIETSCLSAVFMALTH